MAMNGVQIACLLKAIAEMHGGTLTRPPTKPRLSIVARISRDIDVRSLAKIRFAGSRRITFPMSEIYRNHNPTEQEIHFGRKRDFDVHDTSAIVRYPPKR